MISGEDAYRIVAAITPLYVAMALAYAAVRFCKIFTPQQCAGVSTYVATFAVPILSFHVIASCDFSDMNYRFLGADTLQKLVILASLGLWSTFGPNASLEWAISFFSLSTLPNTLIIGIPLLQAMYGGSSSSLMVQIVVLQVLIWYTLLLILFEYKGAMILINGHFPDCSGAIRSIRVDPDVVSLNGREPLEAEAEVDGDGKVHVVFRRSLEGLSSVSITPRASNLSGVEIYSLRSLSRASSLNWPDGRHGSQRLGISGSTEAASSLRDSKPANARADWIVDAETACTGERRHEGRSLSSESMKGYPVPLHQPSSHSILMTSAGEVPVIFGGGNSGAAPAKGLHMYAWGSSADKSGRATSRITHGSSSDLGARGETTTITGGRNFRARSNERAENASETSGKEWNAANTELGMPPGSAMARLVVLMVWRKLSRNPNLYASVLGLAWSLLSFKLHIRLPLIVAGSIQILSDTGLGMAMFSLGLYMGSQPKLVPCGYSSATLAMALRFVVGPVVAAATSAALGLRGDLLRISIVQAALPEAIVPFVFASEYRVHADIMSVAVVFGILISLPVALLYGAVLGAI